MSSRLIGVLISTVLLGVVACDSAPNGPDRYSEDLPPNAFTGEIAIGPKDAPVTILEYASTTCPACEDFHSKVGPVLKEYVAQGKVRWVFREYPTAPREISIAGAITARCAGEAEAFNVIDDLFKNQGRIITAVQAGAGETALMAVGERFGVNAEEFQTCRTSEALINTVADVVDEGTKAGVTGTPTVFYNGARLRGGQGLTAESMRALIEASLSAETSED